MHFALGISLLSLALAQGKTVTTVRPERCDLSRSVSRAATATALAEATLVARVDGYVEEVAVEEGDVVPRGSVVAKLSVPDLEAEVGRARAGVSEAEAALVVAEAEVRERGADVEVARANLEWLEKEAKRVAGLRAEGAATERDEEEAEARHDAAKAEATAAEARVRSAEAKVALARAKIEAARAEATRFETLVAFAEVRAPYAKTLVTRRLVHPGALAEAGRTALLSVSDVERIRVRSDVTEREAPFVKPGTPVRIAGAAIASSIEAAVTRTAGAVDVETRNLRLEVEVPNEDRRLLPGLYLDLRLELERREGALVVPAAALLIVEGKPHLFVVNEGKAHLRAVRTGLDDGARVEIVEGIEADDAVVVAGKERLSDGDAVAAVPEKVRP